MSFASASASVEFPLGDTKIDLTPPTTDVSALPYVPAPEPAMSVVSSLPAKPHGMQQITQMSPLGSVGSNVVDHIVDRSVLEKLAEIQRQELVRLEVEEVSLAMQRASVNENLQQVLRRLGELTE